MDGLFAVPGTCVGNAERYQGPGYPGEIAETRTVEEEWSGKTPNAYRGSTPSRKKPVHHIAGRRGSRPIAQNRGPERGPHTPHKVRRNGCDGSMGRIMEKQVILYFEQFGDVEDCRSGDLRQVRFEPVFTSRCTLTLLYTIWKKSQKNEGNILKKRSDSKKGRRFDRNDWGSLPRPISPSISRGFLQTLRLTFAEKSHGKIRVPLSGHGPPATKLLGNLASRV